MESKGILFLMQTHKPWDLSKEGDYGMFYDPVQKRIALHQSLHVYAFEIYDKTKDSNPVYFMLPASYKQILVLAISRNDQFMAIQDTPLHINFIYFGQPTLDQKREAAQMRQASISLSADRVKVLGVSFVQFPAVDLVVCHCKGLELYKFKKNIENVKSIGYKTLGAWIDPLQGIIVLSSSATKGEMQTYHLKKDEAKGKNIKGSGFSLMLRQADAPNTPKSEKKKRDEVAQKFYCEVPQLLTKNIHLYSEEIKALESKRQESFQIHKILFGQLYSKNVLVHYNQTQGIVHVYRFAGESVERSLNVLTLDPTINYEVQMADNLILVSNKSTSLFSTYDSKSMYKLKQPLFQNGKVDLSYADLYFCDNLEESDTQKTKKASNETYLIVEPVITVEDLTEDSSDVSDFHSNTYIQIKCNLTNDSTHDSLVLAPEASPKAKAPEFSLKDYIALDSNLTFSLKDKKFFAYMFNKKSYFSKVAKKIPGLINLMRRGNPKEVILSSIRQLMEKGVSLQKLSKLFEKISTVYQLARTKGIIVPEKSEPHEVKRVTKPMALVKQSYYNSGRDRPTIYMSKVLEGTLFTKCSVIATGEAVITQKELIDSVFTPLLASEHFSSVLCRYLITAMLEYQRSLSERDLLIDLNMQIAWLHYIVEHKEFQYLQMLQQYAILPDTPEIASEFLYAARGGCLIAWQIAVDMYHRMGKHQEVLKIILERDKVEDAVDYVERYGLKGTKAKEILEAVHRLSEKERILYVEYFIKAAVMFEYNS
eukprot:TRINITY_DN8260_c0_g1_i7.p1 TRINITY_DN8260_c0_g1~~TRINITY_DN8260_c0_g1_i7.p1  ORF type:complete len:765 (-),score=200.79 TRINITY_DN8260_c0_g1_i7:237-2531(-)